MFIFMLSSCAEKPEVKLQLATQGAYSGALEKHGASLVVGSFQHGGSFWDIHQQSREYNWNHRDGYLTEILYADISDNGRYAITVNYYNLVLWDTQTGHPVWFWSAPARIEAADLSADGRFVILGLDNNKAVLFDAQNGGLLREFEHQGPVISVAINISTGLVLTGSEDSTAKLWNIRTAELIKTFSHDNQVSVVKLSDSGQFMLIAPAHEKAEVWNTVGQTKITELSTAKFRIYSARFIGDTRLVVGTTHRNIFEFDVATGKKIETYQIGTEGKQSFKSAIVLDVTKQGSQLLAIGSNGYLYTF
jgi:WD40 repeat protein